MIKIKEIDKKLFDDYLSKHENQHFLQTSAIGYRRSIEGWETYLLGFFKDNNLVGAMQMNGINVFLNYKRYEVVMGPLLDYDNKVETSDALKALKEYIDDIKAIECNISPNLVTNVHYPELESLRDKDEIIKIFKGSGWSLVEGLDALDSKLRWFFKKDIKKFETYKDLTDSYDRETRRLIANAKTFPLKVIELEENNLSRAVNILDETGERRDFSTRDSEYHKSLYKYMNEDNEAKYLVVELNVKQYLDILQKEADQIKQDIIVDADNDSKRARNRVNQNQDQLKARENRIQQLKEIKAETVDICSGVFIGANNTMTYLFGGSKKEFMRYYGTYFLQDYTIHYAYDKGYEIYDFYGTRSKISGFPEEEGIFDFKKGFGGKLYENIGYFEYKPKNLINTLIETLRKIKHAIIN